MSNTGGILRSEPPPPMVAALMLFGGLLACMCLTLALIDYLTSLYPMGC